MDEHKIDIEAIFKQLDELCAQPSKLKSVVGKHRLDMIYGYHQRFSLEVCCLTFFRNH